MILKKQFRPTVETTFRQFTESFTDLTEQLQVVSERNKDMQKSKKTPGDHTDPQKRKTCCVCFVVCYFHGKVCGHGKPCEKKFPREFFLVIVQYQSFKIRPGLQEMNPTSLPDLFKQLRTLISRETVENIEIQKT